MPSGTAGPYPIILRVRDSAATPANVNANVTLNLVAPASVVQWDAYDTQ